MNQLPNIQDTKSEVFILESLDHDDEAKKRFEGRLLSEMLQLAGKNPKYYYFQSENELPPLVDLFRQSQYRYLHISSHASDTDIELTNGSISYSRFAEIFKGHLILRRLFFSACQIGNKEFVQAVSSQNKGMHSIVAPTKDIQFDHSAAIWTSFYVSMFTENEKAMKHKDIQERLEALSRLFPVEFHFATYESTKDNWGHRVIGASTPAKSIIKRIQHRLTSRSS